MCGNNQLATTKNQGYFQPLREELIHQHIVDVI
jgi:hypothetical protein